MATTPNAPITTARFQIGVDDLEYVKHLLDAWLRSDPRVGTEEGKSVGLCLPSGECSEGGLKDCFIPGIEELCSCNLLLLPGETPGWTYIVFDNHPETMLDNPLYYNAQAFAFWFSTYLYDQDIGHWMEMH